MFLAQHVLTGSNYVGKIVNFFLRMGESEEVKDLERLLEKEERDSHE